MTINRKIYFTNNKGFDSKVDPATFNFKIRIFDSKLNERLHLFSFYFMNLKSHNSNSRSLGSGLAV